MNEKIPKFKGEKNEEIPKFEEEENTESWTEVKKNYLEKLQRSSEAKDIADVEKLRTEMDLPTDGPGVEIPGDDTVVAEDVLAKAKAKGLVFEMDDDLNSPENIARIKKTNEQRRDLTAEEKEDGARSLQEARKADEIIETKEELPVTREDALAAGVKLEEIEAIENYTQAGEERENALRGAIDRQKKSTGNN